MIRQTLLTLAAVGLPCFLTSAKAEKLTYPEAPKGDIVEELCDDCHDIIKWIDTSAMLVDSLTKHMKHDIFVKMFLIRQC